jgi:hypothetical protein
MKPYLKDPLFDLVILGWLLQRTLRERANKRFRQGVKYPRRRLLAGRNHVI